MGHATAVVGEQARGCGQPRDGLLEGGGGRVVVDAGDDQRQEIEIQGVAVIVGGAFAMSAVDGDLPHDFVEEDAPAGLHASAAGGQLRDGVAADVERQGLAEQMRVRAEVARQVMFDVRQLQIEREQQIDEPGC